MGLFNFENRRINLFAADCMKALNETASKLGAISDNKIITNEELTNYGEFAINTFIKQDPALYGGVENFVEDSFYFTISMGIVLAARLRYDKLTQEYVVKAINESPSEVGINYLELVGLDDMENQFYEKLLAKFLSLYSQHITSDKNRAYLKQALLVVYAIGSTIALG